MRNQPSITANKITKKVWEKPSVEVISYYTVQAGVQPGIEEQPIPDAASPHTPVFQLMSALMIIVDFA